MKIVFREKIPDNIDVPFGIYEYDEVLAQHPNYVDLRGIIRDKCWVWLAEIQESHAYVSSKFLRYTRWWWVTGASRLNIQAWGQEYLFKPLFFSKAVLEWIKSNSHMPEFYMIRCNPLVGVYLLEFDDNLVLDKGRRYYERLSIFFSACSRFILDVLMMLNTTYNVLRHHVFRKGSGIDAEVLIMHESINGSSISGRKYFYGAVFDSLMAEDGKRLSYCCTSLRSANLDNGRGKFLEDKSGFFLLDKIRLRELILAMIINVSLIFVAWVVGFSRFPCSIGKSVSKVFWGKYLRNELMMGTCLINICCYWALRRIFKESGEKRVILQYEEKGRERAIVMACQEYGCEVIGYVCNPMHRTLAALQDIFKPMAPKPDRYGVCGSSYVDYFVSWGKKDRDSIRIWGSGKEWTNSTKVKKINRSNFRILLLCSHPNELRVFQSWLRSEKRLSCTVTYFVRRYKSAGPKAFKHVLKSLMMEFECIKETDGSLTEDLSLCDVAVFCATSAGIDAVKHGYLSIYLDLNDIFDVNPCFDKLDSMLPCKSALEFANRLDEICDMDEESLLQLHDSQKIVADQIFGPIQKSLIKEDLFC